MISKLHDGLEVEERASEFLLARGYTILRRNVHFRRGELDLVCLENRDSGVELVFVEVRARREGSWLKDVEAIDARKRARLEYSAKAYLASYRGQARTLRFDLLVWSGEAWTHLLNAW